MTVKPIDLSRLVKAIAQLQEALRVWHELPQGASRDFLPEHPGQRGSRLDCHVDVGPGPCISPGA